MRRTLVALLACVALDAHTGGLGGKPLPWLEVSENRRFLVTADGRPFFWQWLGRRYRDSGIRWILGGERPT